MKIYRIYEPNCISYAAQEECTLVIVKVLRCVVVGRRPQNRKKSNSMSQPNWDTQTTYEPQK